MLTHGRHAAARRVVTMFMLAVGCSSDDDATGSPAAPEESGTSTAPEASASASASVEEYEVPAGSHPHDVAVAEDGTVWYTAQGSGELGRLDIDSGDVELFDAPRGRGPYGISATPDGEVYFASLAGSYLAHVDLATGEPTVIEPPTAAQGTGRVWADSQGRLWTSQWEAGQVAVYDPAANQWEEWRLPGDSPQAYSVYVDDQDQVWLSDFGANTLVAFDPVTEEFTSYPLPSQPGEVRQIHGRPGEVWGAESAADKLVVVRRD